MGGFVVVRDCFVMIKMQFQIIFTNMTNSGICLITICSSAEVNDRQTTEYVALSVLSSLVSPFPVFFFDSLLMEF
jgi:hypothetical protein